MADIGKIFSGIAGALGGPIGFIGGQLVSAYLQNKAMRKVQKAEQDYAQAVENKQGDIEAFEEEQRQLAISERRDIANTQEQAQNVAAARNAAEAGLSRVATRDSQAMADEFGRQREGVAGQFFGPGGGRAAELERLRKIRESDMIAEARPVTSQFSGAGVSGTPASWANAYNIRAGILGKDVDDRAKLLSALSSRSQDAGLQSFKGMRDLQKIDTTGKSMADAFAGVDVGEAELKLGDTARKASGEKAVATGDIAHGYNLPVRPPSTAVDTSGLAKAEAKAAKYGMYGSILGSITDAARYS